MPQELYTIFQGFPRTGTSGASQVLRHLSSCMPRPEDSGGPAQPGQIGCAHVAFGSVKTLGVRNCHVEAVPALQGARSPLRPTGCSVYASPILFAVIPHDSAMDARLDTGGWLPLTRQGLSPCKRRQAFLGAITLGFRRRQEPQRGTSGGCWRSPASPCSAPLRPGLSACPVPAGPGAPPPAGYPMTYAPPRPLRTRETRLARWRSWALRPPLPGHGGDARAWA